MKWLMNLYKGILLTENNSPVNIGTSIIAAIRKIANCISYLMLFHIKFWGIHLMKVVNIQEIKPKMIMVRFLMVMLMHETTEQRLRG